MKIIWFNVSLEQSGGGERLSLEVVRSCRELGHDSYYLTYSYDYENTFGGKYDFIKPISRGEKKLLQAKGTKLLKRFFRILWLRGELKRLKPDLIITSGTWGHVVDVYFATLFTNFIYITHVFGSLFAFTPEKESLKYAKVFKKNFLEIYKSVETYSCVVPLTPPKASLFVKIKREISALFKYWAVRKSNRIFVLSERNRWETQKLYGRDSVALQGAFPDNIFNYNLKSNLKTYLNFNNKKVILSVGRLAANKRIDLAILSFDLLQKRSPDTVLVIGGCGPERENLEKLVKELKLEEKVIFIGFVDEEYLWDYYATCDLFLHLDLADFDIAPLEALAVGSKVVWSNEIDIPKLEIDFKGLWSVTSQPSNIADIMFEAIEAKLSKEDLIERKARLKVFSWEEYTKQMLGAVKDQQC